jgi:hypothetical protein
MYEVHGISEDYVMDVLLCVLPSSWRKLKLGYKWQYPINTEEYGVPMDISVLTPSEMSVVYVVKQRRVILIDEVFSFIHS